MAFFEDLGKKISQTSQGVVQKTKDTAEVMKLNGLISDEEKNVNNFYSLIGKKYFELYAENPDQDFANMVQAIKNSQIKIRTYSDQIKKLKGITQCPNCGSDVGYGIKFCSACGGKMPEVNANLRCVVCGATIAEGCAFCTTCGTKVERANETKAVPAEPVAPAPAPVVSANFCTNCNAQLEEGVAFCTACGTKVEPAKETEAPVAPAPAVSASICPNCNAQLGADAAFCTSCGTKVGQTAAAPTPTVSNVCPNCNAEIAPGSLFCTSCGTKL